MERRAGMRIKSTAYWVITFIALIGLSDLSAAQTYWLSKAVVNSAGNTYSGSGKNLADSEIIPI
jgi:hypothetical protein